jgi:hypothetical protein
MRISARDHFGMRYLAASIAGLASLLLLLPVH